MATYRSIDGDMIDAVCRRFYGREAGAVEAVLEANPGLADFGPVLPAGTVVQLPRRYCQVKGNYLIIEEKTVCSGTKNQ